MPVRQLSSMLSSLAAPLRAGGSRPRPERNSRPRPERSSRPHPKVSWRLLSWSAAVTIGLSLLAPAAAQAGTANAGIASLGNGDPLAGLNWGYYTGTLDDVYPAYQAANGEDKQLLAEVALRPEAYWFGDWNPNPTGAARNFIKQVTQGNPNVLVQLTDFRLDPWEHGACGKVPSASDIRSYERWTDGFARGIGNARVALILQPDLPVQHCVPSDAPKQEVAYAAARFSALPHTDVYIDVGASDWLRPWPAARLLLGAGIRHARGFALDATHYASTATQIVYGQQVVRLLARHGVHGVHFVIDTAENGEGFTHQSWHGSYWANAAPCRSRSSRHCVTFGIPPTWDVGNPAWNLGPKLDAIADKLVDGYLWFGRPWLYGQKGPFDESRVLQMARTTPFPFAEFGEDTVG